MRFGYRGLGWPMLVGMALGLAGCGHGRTPATPYLRLEPISPSGLILGPVSASTFQYKAALMAWFDRADLNHDRVLTVDEMVADADHAFDILDRDHDGSITPAELEHYRLNQPFRARRRPATLALGTQDRTVTPGSVEALTPNEQAQAGERVRLQMGLDPVMSADTDSDFRVTREELRAQARRKFASWDTNHDGRVTVDEFLTAMMAPLRALTEP